MQTTSNLQVSRPVANYEVAVVTSDGRSFRGNVNEESNDGMCFVCSHGMKAKRGDAVVVKSSRSPRTGIVLCAEANRRGTRVAVQWMSSHFRERAKNSGKQFKSWPEFEQHLPWTLHSLWQLLDGNKKPALLEFIDDVTHLARSSGITLDASDELRHAVELNDTRSARKALLRLCHACVADEVFPITDSRRLGAGQALHLCGVPAWTLGVVLCVAGRLLCLG